ncbi:MAG TPA: guanylate kinase, partial [Bacteroidales bacterium]|nr:guanylate kinase [Bacteroidales bacterium]
PSPEVLEQRLRKRSTESEQELSVRLGKASEEMARADEFDAMIVNEDLEVAIAEAIHRVSAFLHPIP